MAGAGGDTPVIPVGCCAELLSVVLAFVAGSGLFEATDV